MFVGSIPKEIRSFFTAHAQWFCDKTVVIGCSGNFTLESTLAAVGCTQLHSNDVSLYSCMLGAWFRGEPFRCIIRERDFQWLDPWWHDPTTRLAALMALMDMLPYERQRTTHEQRLWDAAKAAFAKVVQRTVVSLQTLRVPITSLFCGDVCDHFDRFAHDSHAVFCCFAPTYARGYERLYKRLHALFDWDIPTYTVLDAAARDRVLAWMAERHYCWIDDRYLEGLPLVYKHVSSRAKTLYIYSNMPLHPWYLARSNPVDHVSLPLVGASFCAHHDDTLTCIPLSPSALAPYKDMFLNKAIDHARGMWAFAVVLQQQVVGFFEFKKNKFRDQAVVYLNADFPVSGTHESRLSKLMVMLACSGETRTALERACERRLTGLVTTAFTDKPVSMKYRGVLTLHARGTAKDGRHFLQYHGRFTDATWQETYAQWWTKHASQPS